MLRETKFGYGFLLLGTAMPYLIDKALGLTAAILASVICLVFGGILLWSGHKHKDGILLPFKGWREWSAFGAASCTLVILLTAGFRRAAQPGESVTEASKSDLEYAPAVSVLYDTGRIKVFNTGRSSVSLWGFDYGNKKPEIDKEPREIAPNFYFYLLSDNKLEQQFLHHLQIGQEGSTPCRVYVSTIDSKKYTVNCLLVAKKDSDSRVIIHTQMVSTISGWN